MRSIYGRLMSIGSHRFNILIRPLMGVALLTALLLVGCGYQLRGTAVDGRSIPVIYLQGPPGSALLSRLNQLLLRANVATSDDREQAQWWLSVVDEQRQRRVLSVDSRGKAQEFELRYSLLLDVRKLHGAPLLQDELIEVLREYAFDSGDVLAKTEEEKLLYDSMEQQAAQIILRRLQALAQHTP